ncbi:GMC family oxidoreductase N-terminal domain-containing protein [Robertmurraya korlensis]|uniref:GMC family oxidoreductase N-terminal domain-containing protein n=1 Tax=Robertmurraya korlensis TaxID=519977 RepID=UPI00203E60BB|nr:GMC family oxidoreductase N-terminal domain-containing protein [Robertmurraya korlensis]MCM3603054.1 GMC family oxidoreductase N-terminal domain-containing protein [Robertmurraya korlensis]
MSNPDVIVIGAGGGGAVIAKELGEKGLKVLIVEAGPWYGNQKWPNPNLPSGDKESSEKSDLDITLYRQQMNKYEDNMNNLVTGRFRWGPANRDRAPWIRLAPHKQIIWQSAGVGGSTQHYTANSPRAFPSAIDQFWPLSYRELIPYYEKVEATLPVHFAPTTAKEELFYFGAKRAGWNLNATLNVTSPGYRPQPNAILPVNKDLNNINVSLEQLSWMEGCTLCGHCINGCPHGPSVEKVAKRSTNVSYIPLALSTGNVTIRPNSFTIKILTDTSYSRELHAAGVRIRDTWTGEEEELRAKVVVLAGGSIESPRLWLNSNLPENPWVGKGLTNHYMDWVTGIFNEKDLMSILGETDINPFIGHTCGARFDFPGFGSLQTAGMSPGLTASLSYGISQFGWSIYQKEQSKWEFHHQLVGSKLKDLMVNYRKTLNILIITDDEVDQRNGVNLHPTVSDEHGPVPILSYTPTKKSIKKRKELMKMATYVLHKAGAKEIISSNWPAGIMIHLESTMRMGFVVDSNGEAYQVKQLFIADNSVHFNGLGGVNPTLTTQALATRTGEKLFEKYFN